MKVTEESSEGNHKIFGGNRTSSGRTQLGESMTTLTKSTGGSRGEGGRSFLAEALSKMVKYNH
ncbi:unnamed protein product, partial [Nezara viridula]